ncbi:MAG: hypothetical protein ACO1SX_02905 [Actinomycetota bacterium]
MSERTIRDEAPIFRGIRFGYLEQQSGALTHRAFLLCKPEEHGLSISEIQERALNSLSNLKGTARLVAGEVRAAELDGSALGLQVTPMHKESDPGYGQVLNLPPYAAPDAPGRIRANQAADALLQLATYEPR